MSTRFPQPFYLVYLNHDYDETVHPVRTPQDVVTTLSQRFGVGIMPLKGVGDEFWSEIREAYEQNWKGASAFLVNGTGPEELQPVDEIHLTPSELAMATIETDLTENPDQPVFAVLMNKDFSESAVILDDRRAVIAKLIEVMEINTAEIEIPDDFADLVQESYAAGGWKGLLIASVHPQTIDYELIGPEELGFTMEDLVGDDPELMEP